MSELQRLTQQRLERCALEHLKACSADSPQECFRNLLGGRSLYAHMASSGTVPFKNAAVSLPSGVQGAPLLRSILPRPEAIILERFEEEMLKDPTEVRRIRGALGAPNSYMDPQAEGQRQYVCKVCEKMYEDWDNFFHTAMKM